MDYGAIKAAAANAGNEPIYRVIAERLISSIEEGVIKPGERLPAVRALAKELGVSNGTAQAVYRHLETRKAVYTAVGSGTFAASLGASGLIPPEPYPETRPKNIPGAVSFVKGAEDIFPVARFREAFSKVLSRDGGAAFGYEDRLGYAPLRGALSGYLAGSGICAEADAIQIISGAQQGIDVAARAIIRRGDAAIVESPAYYGAVGALNACGAEVTAVEITESGIDAQKLEWFVKQRKPSLIYVTPYFQTPTCAVYSLENKRALIEMAAKYQFYIVEEDLTSDFYNGAAVPLKALDYKNRVVYVKSFSKILMPGLRIGFMVLPKALRAHAASAKYTSDIETSGLIQRAFEAFICAGGLNGHIASARGVYKRRGELLLKSADAYWGGLAEVTAGGVNAWCAVKQSVDPAAFFSALSRNGVIVTPGHIYSVYGPVPGFFRLGLSGLTDGEIDEGAQRVGECLRAAAKGKPPADPAKNAVD
jgi:DNA-binding transcriptional MocR family regulator